MLFEFKTAKWTEWAKIPIDHKNWSHDGKFLYYDTNFDQHSTFRRVRVGETRSQLVADLQSLRRYSGWPVFGWSGLGPDGSALFTRDLSSDEIYALDLDLP